MLRLVWYEWKKAFTKKSILIILLLFVIINFLKIESLYKDNSYLSGKEGTVWSNSFWKMYSTYKGEITTEKVKKLLEIYHPLEEKILEMTANTAMDDPNSMTGNVYSDYNLLDRYLVTPMKYFYNYGAKADESVLQAKENVAYYKKVGNTYESKKNAVIYYLFRDREIPQFAYLEMQEYFINYDFSDILLLFLILYGIMGVFGCEIEGKMNHILLTNKNGRKKTMIAKIFATSIYVYGVSIMFSVLDYLSFIVVFHSAEGVSMPIYSISFFASTPIKLSIIQYVIVSAIIKGLGFLVIGLLFLAIARICKNSLFSFATGILVSTLLALISTKFKYSDYIWLKIISPYSLVTNMHLFEKTEFVSVLGNPILSYQVAIILAIVSSILLIIFLICNSGNNEHCRRRICMK